jgi:hypothetical protein
MRVFGEIEVERVEAKIPRMTHRRTKLTNSPLGHIHVHTKEVDKKNTTSKVTVQSREVHPPSSLLFRHVDSPRLEGYLFPSGKITPRLW